MRAGPPFALANVYSEFSVRSKLSRASGTNLKELGRSAMQSRITGTTMPVLEFALEPNDSIISEAGELSWMSSSIQMTTHTQFGGGGGLFGVLKRVAGGGSIFMTEYRAVGAVGELAFATKLPGHIVPVEISPGHEYM